uniref:Selenoprotein O n=1 Tax=Pavo cristatus TaxID=9049 RepID=A0A8C9LFE9_PAVCR
AFSALSALSSSLALRSCSPCSPSSAPERADGGGWLRALRFDNLALRSLPVDPSEDSAPRAVPGACFARVRPTPLRNPRLVAMSPPALALLGLEAGGPEAEREAEAALYFSGNRLLPGSEPAAHCYCGHQFGSFAGQLGDGAAIYLGEVRGPRGARWELQLKGAGITPFSRQADGRKVLRSSIREFLCSEAMFHLGIPTTRAGTCVTSDSEVPRFCYFQADLVLLKFSSLLMNIRDAKVPALTGTIFEHMQTTAFRGMLPSSRR